MTVNIENLIKNTNVNLCIECGKCTSNCPVARFNPDFSPRVQLTTFSLNKSDNFLQSDRIWNCLTCGMCSVRCPMGVQFTEFTKRVRSEAFQIGREANCAHGGALQSLMKIMTSNGVNQNRLEWVPADAQIAETGDTLYFVGCAPYFDAFFTELKINTLNIAQSTIRVLNKLGIKPVLLKNERCCGHDLLWAGDLQNYKNLAQKNLEAIKKVNPKRIVFSCAECYRTFKKDYAEAFGPFDFEMLHISELLSAELANNKLKIKKSAAKITYQDPCRLGRHLNIYDQPRTVLSAISGSNFIEMQKNRQNAVCCGTNSWINCDSYSKMIQAYRLKMARQTGATELITSCPKCYIHFSCAMSGDKFPGENKINIKDLAVFAAEALA
jgi:heterodisulfide reductase subunit D